MASFSLNPNQRETLRQQALRDCAAQVGYLIARQEVVEVWGNICIEKSTLVSRLAGYFAEEGVDSDKFIDLAYSRR